MSEHNGQLPNSKKVYVSGELHPDLRVPFREISLAPTKTMSGQIDGSAGDLPVLLPNESLRVYDTSGPWTDSDVRVDAHAAKAVPAPSLGGIPTTPRTTVER